MNIRYVPFEEIDILRWDSCIHYSINGNVFGYHWFLKNVAREFDGLVEGNYESVMPILTRNSRWNYSELYHPKDIGRLGIFSVHVLSESRIQKFLESIPENHIGKDIDFNEHNKSYIKDLTNSHRSNWFELNLSQPYEIIQNGYSDIALDQIKESKSENWMAHSNIKPEELVNFFSTIDNSTDKHMWMRIHYNLMHRGTAFPTVYSSSSGEIAGAALFCYYNGFFTLLNYKAKPGLENKLFYRMSDDLIRLHATRTLRFDFNIFGEEYEAGNLGAIKKNVYQLKTTPSLGRLVRNWLVD